MRTEELDFHLPPELQAYGPVEPRGQAKMVTLWKRLGKIEHLRFEDFPEVVGNVPVWANNSKMLRWRITLYRDTGQAVEADLVRKIGDRTYEAVVKTVDSLIALPAQWSLSGDLSVDVAVSKPEGHSAAVVTFSKEPDFEKVGTLTLPPHVRNSKADEPLYEPIYAKAPGALGSPLAGHHFTSEMIARLNWHELTLHIRPETPLYIHTARVEEYEVFSPFEAYEIPDPLPAAPVCAVGTTTVRALEEFARTGKPRGETCLYIAPGFDFKLTRMFLTCLHRPRETTLLMACAFGGKDLVLAAYRECVERRYRWSDYGDLMLILP